MQITPAFVLALAAATYGSASPVLKRQMSSDSMSMPTASASGAAGSSASSSAMPTASMPASPAAAPGSGSNSSMPTGPMRNSTMGNSTSSSMTFNDTQILQYALTLEHLEATFYNQSLNKFSTSDFENAGYNGSVRNQIYSIGRDEASHVAFLTQALGNESVSACTYDFSSVTDVQSFLTTARVLEDVGVSAYLGATQNITNKDYIEAAGSILTVESRHASYLIAQTDDGGNAIPSAFDTPLDFKQVYSLAAPFIQSCPQNASLPITAFPSLTLSGGASNGSFTPGQQVTVSFENSTMSSGGSNSTNSTSSGSGSQYLAIIQGVTGPQFLPLNGSSNSSVTLPSNLTGGQMYAVVTSSNNAVTNDNTLAGPAVGYVNIPLPQAPVATNSSSSSSNSSSSSSSSSTGSATATGGASSMSSSSAAAPTDTASSSMSLGASAASVASANLPTPSASTN